MYMQFSFHSFCVTLTVGNDIYALSAFGVSNRMLTAIHTKSRPIIRLYNYFHSSCIHKKVWRYPAVIYLEEEVKRYISTVLCVLAQRQTLLTVTI